MKDLKGFEEYMHEEELSKNTISSYLISANMFFENFDELNKKNLILWKEQLSNKFSPKTVNLRLSAMECYCKYKDLNFRVKRVKEQKRTNVENVITLEQYQNLINGLKADGNERLAFNIEILAKTGARISEALRLTKDDLVRGYADLYTKCKCRRVYIPKSLLDDAPQYVQEMKGSDYLMNSCRGKSLTDRGFDAAIKKAAEKYGIPRKNCHAHAFRHLFAIQFLKRTNNITLLADILGHSGVNTTMIYTRMSAEQQKEAINNAVDW